MRDFKYKYSPGLRSFWSEVVTAVPNGRGETGSTPADVTRLVSFSLSCQLYILRYLLFSLFFLFFFFAISSIMNFLKTTRGMLSQSLVAQMQKLIKRLFPVDEQRADQNHIRAWRQLWLKSAQIKCWSRNKWCQSWLCGLNFPETRIMLGPFL